MSLLRWATLFGHFPSKHLLGVILNDLANFGQLYPEIGSLELIRSWQSSSLLYVCGTSMCHPLGWQTDNRSIYLYIKRICIQYPVPQSGHSHLHVGIYWIPVCLSILRSTSQSESCGFINNGRTDTGCAWKIPETSRACLRLQSAKR